MIFSKDTSIESGGTFNIACNITVKDSRRFTAEVTDMSGLIVTASTSVFNYVYPYYYQKEKKMLNDAFIKKEAVLKRLYWSFFFRYIYIPKTWLYFLRRLLNFSKK